MIDRRCPDYDNTPVSSKRPVVVYRPVDLTVAPVVSFITPFYNGGALFDETARCILGQTLQQWEWIVVNDGSDDAASLQVLDAWRGRDPRVRVVDHPVNRGLSAARNTGFREARAELVLQIDADDLLEPTAAEKLLWFLESHPACGFAKGHTVGFGAQTYLWEKGFHCRETFLEENQVEATCLVRRSVHQAVGGYDEQNRGGLEDWDFWLRCAHAGYWGDTVAEPMSWYRRRHSHGDVWANWDGADAQARFRSELRRRYPRLWKNGFPRPDLTRRTPRPLPPDTSPATNRLAKTRPRLLLIAPWLTLGGADRFNLDLTEQLVARGWEVCIATTLDGDHSWEAEFGRFTSEVFALHRFIHPSDYPRFLRYLILSRDFDVVMVSNSELGYQMLAYLRAHCPGPAFVDYCHMEEEQWNGGGYPAWSVRSKALLDLTMVTSAHLKRWMVARGADADRVEVCHLGVDAAAWRPDAAVRARVRETLAIETDVPVILYAARLTAQKQPGVFAETLALLRRTGRSFVALVAGDGELRPKLDALAARPDMGGCVRVLGALSMRQVGDLMAASDIFFLPSEWEGIALSIFEAMACGLAVVGADVGGQAELVTQGCGMLLPRSDARREAETYAEVLARLLERREEASEMGRRARARVVDRFTTRRLGDRLDTLLRASMLGERRRTTVSVEEGRAQAAPAVAHALERLATLDASAPPRGRWQRKLDKIKRFFGRFGG